MAPKAGCLADDEGCVPELLDDPDDDVVEGDELPPVGDVDAAGVVAVGVVTAVVGVDVAWMGAWATVEVACVAEWCRLTAGAWCRERLTLRVERCRGVRVTFAFRDGVRVGVMGGEVLSSGLLRTVDPALADTAEAEWVPVAGEQNGCRDRRRDDGQAQSENRVPTTRRVTGQDSRIAAQRDG